MKILIAILLTSISIGINASQIHSAVASRHVSMSDNADNTSYSARDYVQDGLVAIWDGYYNDGWDSHVDYTNEWVDLVNGFVLRTSNDVLGDFTRHCMDYQVAFYNGAGDPITLSGIRDYDKMINLRRIINQGLFTIEISHRPKVQLIADSWAYKNYSCGLFALLSSHSSIVFKYDGSIAIYKNVLKDGSSSIDTGFPFTYREGETRSIVFDSSVSFSYVFVDGDAVAYKELASGIFGNSASGPLLWLNTCIGVVQHGVSTNKWTDQSSVFSSVSDVYCIRIYSRPLSSDEISFNHMIDKKRFGL